MINMIEDRNPTQRSQKQLDRGELDAQFGSFLV